MTHQCVTPPTLGLASLTFSLLFVTKLRDALAGAEITDDAPVFTPRTVSLLLSHIQMSRKESPCTGMAKTQLGLRWLKSEVTPIFTERMGTTRSK